MQPWADIGGPRDHPPPYNMKYFYSFLALSFNSVCNFFSDSSGPVRVLVPSYRSPRHWYSDQLDSLRRSKRLSESAPNRIHGLAFNRHLAPTSMRISSTFLLLAGRFVGSIQSDCRVSSLTFSCYRDIFLQSLVLRRLVYTILFSSLLWHCWLDDWNKKNRKYLKNSLHQ